MNLLQISSVFSLRKLNMYLNKFFAIKWLEEAMFLKDTLKLIKNLSYLEVEE